AGSSSGISKSVDNETKSQSAHSEAARPPRVRRPGERQDATRSIAMPYRVGVDIGGSFTDFAFFDENNKYLRTLKVLSRPDQPGAEVLDGIRLAGALYGIAPDQISYFTHGTTVGLNAVIERKGLKLALFTTEHFRDVLEVARLKIPDMYNLLSRRPDPLITRDMVFGIPGR